MKMLWLNIGFLLTVGVIMYAVLPNCSLVKHLLTYILKIICITLAHVVIFIYDD